MLIFGTIGVFVRYIPLASSAVALARAVIGVLFLCIVMIISKMRISFSSIRKNLLLLIIAGIALGFNWILLFESYRYTAVATATLCYYLAPTFVIIFSPFVLKEKLSLRKVMCVVVSLVGMVFVSGVLNAGFAFSQIKGVLLGIGAAVLYSVIILLNKRMKEIQPFDVTVFELFCSAVILLPYVLSTADFSTVTLTMGNIVMLLVVGIVHTGLAYALYFGSISKIPAQTVALLSYIDPVFAIILSAVILKEGLTIYSLVGASLILGSSVIGELKNK